MTKQLIMALCVIGMTVFGQAAKPENSGIEEGFEGQGSKFKMKVTGDGSWDIDKNVKKSGKQSLHLKLNNFFPENLISGTSLIPVASGGIYQLNISFRAKGIIVNPKLKRQPALPEVRVILCNEKKKPATKVSGFIWLRSPAKNISEEWQTISKIIKIPNDVYYLSVTFFDYHKGDMWIDDVSLLKIK